MKKVILILLVLIIAVVVFLPFVLSSAVGRPFLIRYLENRLNGNIAIGKVDLTWKGPQTFKNVTFASPETIATIRHLQSPVPFWKLHELKRHFSIQDGTFTFPRYNAHIIQTNAEVQDSDLHIIAATTQGGSLNIQGRYVSQNDFQLNVELQQIPTIAVAQFFKIDLLPVVLGPNLNLNGVFSQGTAHANLTSTQATAFLKGVITNDLFTLTEAFRGSLRISDAFRAELMKQISPNILTDFSLKNPITLNVPAGNFRLPFSQVNISNAVVDFGQARITSGESLRSLLSLFKPINKKFDAWFTPITFGIQNGNTKIERFDALFDQNIHLASWGEIRNDKLRMTLGVPSDTLKAIFGVETLSSNYVLTIPIRGTIQNPKFETSAAIAKIATMSAAKHIPTKAGKVFGGAANFFAQTQDEESIPPPKQPFPWH